MIIATYVPNHRTPKIQAARTARISGRNRKPNNNSWRTQYPFFLMDRTTREKINEERKKPGQHYKPIRAQETSAELSVQQRNTYMYQMYRECSLG